MGKYVATVEDHLVLPARVRATPGRERLFGLSGESVPTPVPIRLLIDTGAKRTTLIPGIIRHLQPFVGGEATYHAHRHPDDGTRLGRPGFPRYRAGIVHRYPGRSPANAAGAQPVPRTARPRPAEPVGVVRVPGSARRCTCAIPPVGSAGCAAGYKSPRLHLGRHQLPVRVGPELPPHPPLAGRKMVAPLPGWVKIGWLRLRSIPKRRRHVEKTPRRMSSRTPESRSELLAQLRADQAQRWQRGERVPVEHYLTQYPDLLANAGALLELIQSEVLRRREVGDAPSLEEYLARFPNQADAPAPLLARVASKPHEILVGQSRQHHHRRRRPLPDPSSSAPPARTRPAGSRNPRATGRGRHGRRLSGAGRSIGSTPGHQGDPPRGVRRPAGPRPLQSRSEGGRPVGSRGRGAHLSAGRARRHPLHLHGVSGGRQSANPPAPGPPGGACRGRVGSAAGPGRAARPRQSRAAPRPQAGQRPAERLRCAKGGRLRPGEVARYRGRSEPGRPRPRHPVVHGAGAGRGAGQRGQGAHRCLGPGDDSLRMPRRPAAVQGGIAQRDAGAGQTHGAGVAAPAALSRCRPNWRAFA